MATPQNWIVMHKITRWALAWLAMAQARVIGTNFLLTGNHFVGYVRNDMYIRPRVAQPVSTYAAARDNPHDNFNFMVWSAFGLQVRRDFAGKSKVFNGYGTQTPQ